jgi:non-ribosomal peptide synthetase component F
MNNDRSLARWSQTIHELFAEQVLQRPEATAISSGGVQISFADLDERTDRIAGWLVAHGVHVDDVVAVEMDRGHDLIAALLGVLKAGGAYLSLESSTPAARREQLVAAAGAVARIAGGDLPAGADLPTLRLPAEPGELAASPGWSPATSPTSARTRPSCTCRRPRSTRPPSRSGRRC